MQNVKNFFIAFGIGIVIFGIFAVAVNKFILTEKEPAKPVSKDDEITSAQTPDSEDENSEVAITGKTFTAVVGGYDDINNELDALIFIKADKENMRFVISAIPTHYSTIITSTDPATGQTVKTNVKIKDYPNKFLTSEKNRKILDVVHAITGMKVDYYAFFDTQAVTKLFEKTAGLHYNVPSSMVYIGNGTEQEPEINLSAGEQVLNAKQAIGLMRFASDTQDERTNFRKRAERQAGFIVSAMTQVLKREPAELISGIVEVLEECETNFTVSDFKDNFELISKFPQYSQNNVIVQLNVGDPLEFTYSQKLFENYK